MAQPIDLGDGAPVRCQFLAQEYECYSNAHIQLTVAEQEAFQGWYDRHPKATIYPYPFQRQMYLCSIHYSVLQNVGAVV